MQPARGTGISGNQRTLCEKRRGMIPDGVEPDLDTNKDLMEKFRR